MLMDRRIAPPVPVVAGALVLACGALAPHAARVFAPQVRGALEVEQRFVLGSPGRWHVNTAGGGSAVEAGAALELRAPPRGSAYLALNGADAARDLARSGEPLRRIGIAPIARHAFDSEETVRWRATSRLDGGYLTL